MNKEGTHPLQLIKDPIAPDSLQLKPLTKATAPHDKNFEANATRQMRMVYPHVTPLSKSPRLVLSPESVKYYDNIGYIFMITKQRHTKGNSKIETRSSIFSTNEMA